MFVNKQGGGLLLGNGGGVIWGLGYLYEMVTVWYKKTCLKQASPHEEYGKADCVCVCVCVCLFQL